MRRSRRDLAIAPPGRRIGGPRKLTSLKEMATNAPTRAPCAPCHLEFSQACRVLEGPRTQRTHGCIDLAEIFPSRLLDMPSVDLAKSRHDRPYTGTLHPGYSETWPDLFPPPKVRVLL